MVTLTPAELDLLSPEERAKHFAAEAETVFGVGFKRDRQGRPIEQGRGAAGRETAEHFAAIRRDEGHEAEQKARAEAARRRP